MCRTIIHHYATMSLKYSPPAGDAVPLTPYNLLQLCHNDTVYYESGVLLPVLPWLQHCYNRYDIWYTTATATTTTNYKYFHSSMQKHTQCYVIIGSAQGCWTSKHRLNARYTSSPGEHGNQTSSVGVLDEVTKSACNTYFLWVSQKRFIVYFKSPVEEHVKVEVN